MRALSQRLFSVSHCNSTQHNTDTKSVINTIAALQRNQPQPYTLQVSGLDGYSDVSYSGYLTVNDQYNSNMFFWFFPAKVN